MKKKIFILLVLLFIFTGIVKAEKCTIVNGNKIDVGSEVACGKEHFYIINNDGENVKMLSKYNLYVGSNYNKINIDINETYIKLACRAPKAASYSCSVYNEGTKYYFEGVEVADREEWLNRVLEKYDLDFLASDNDVIYYEEDHSDEKKALALTVAGDYYTEDGITYQNQTLKLYPYEYIKPGSKGYALQNELAKGVTGNKGNANYPIYGTIYLFSGYDSSSNSDAFVNSLDTFKNGYTNFEFTRGDNIRNYLDDYKDNLTDAGYKIKKTDIMNIKELDDLVYKISNKRLPLTEWYNASLTANSEFEDGTSYQNIGSLKGYVPEKYSWLWSTTYWTKTLVGNEEDYQDGYGGDAYFVSSAGDICYTEGSCYNGVPRAGIRPVVTLAVSEIDFMIETKTDGNGEILVEKLKASSGEVIKFTIKPKEGYVLGVVKVTDANGKVVTFTDYTFTMPDANVLIEATFLPKNPETKDILIVTTTGIAIIAASIVFLNHKKIKEIS